MTCGAGDIDDASAGGQGCRDGRDIGGGSTTTTGVIGGLERGVS